MKVAVFLIISLLAIVLVSGCVSQQTAPNITENQTPYVPAPQQNATAPEQNQTQTPAPSGKTIEITSSGFSPGTLTINAGDTVTFINKDVLPHRPASNVHPLHALYPETGGCIGSKFDACKDLAPGENWSFTFNTKGAWGYHDHLSPSTTATITVQ